MRFIQEIFECVYVFHNPYEFLFFYISNQTLRLRLHYQRLRFAPRHPGAAAINPIFYIYKKNQNATRIAKGLLQKGNRIPPITQEKSKRQ
jgi:hypothetical protein